MEDRSEYLKAYKKYHYSKTRKIVTFPLLLKEFELLKAKAEQGEVTANTLAKEITLSYLENTPLQFFTAEQKEILQQYIRISRNIGNNINQLSHSSNIGERINVEILLDSLKHYEYEFKHLITNLKS